MEFFLASGIDLKFIIKAYTIQILKASIIIPFIIFVLGYYLIDFKISFFGIIAFFISTVIMSYTEVLFFNTITFSVEKYKLFKNMVFFGNFFLIYISAMCANEIVEFVSGLNISMYIFIIMSLVAIIFGILTLFSKGQEKIIGSYTYIDMLWKGYIFLYIIFACELSKDLLQMEKITRRIEWLIANGTRLQSILINHTVSLWISTLLLLMPLLGITIYKIGSPDVAQILDFFTFTLLSSIIINAVILVIRDMNKYKGISLRISVFYFFILIIESMFYSWSNNFILTVIIKYVISLCVSVFVLRMATKERIVMAYY